MAYIYKIINDINNKIYIGKTNFDIKKRFQEHIHDSKKGYQNRPLYKAMNKYGIEHFHIKEIEETDIPEEREVYWINFYNSYKNGYNATTGGDGKTLINYDVVLEKFNQGLTIKAISEEIHHDVGQISKILKSKGITPEEIEERGRTKKKAVVMLDKNTLQELRNFDCAATAAQYCISNNLSKGTVNGISSHICQCCNGIRNSAYKYKWKYKI